MREKVLRIYKKHHSGRENAITRADFIVEHMQKDIIGSDGWWDLSDISDRQFRQLYSQLPIVTCSKGGYYPIRREEILEYRDYLRKKAIPLFSRFKRVCDAHSGLIGDIKQMELFKGDVL